MPPLRVWAVGFAVACVGGYGTYAHVYLPRSLEEERLDKIWEAKRRYVQVLWQQLAVLEDAAAVMKNRSREQLRRSAFPAFDQLELFCKLQQAKASLIESYTSENMAISRTVTQSQAENFLKRVDDIAGQCCASVLPTRSRSLSLRQQITCFLCLLVYIFSFKLMPLLVPQRILEHSFFRSVSQVIVRKLEISCSIETCDASDLSQALAADTPVIVVLPVQHWIEEVGFWACIGNPLVPDAGPEGSAGRVLRVVTSPMTSYDEFWRHRVSTLFPNMHAVRRGHIFGYPLAPPRDLGVLYEATPAFPVAVAGLPELSALSPLRLSRAHRESRKMYDQVVANQFRDSTTEGESSGGSMVTPAKEAEELASFMDATRLLRKYLIPVFGGTGHLHEGISKRLHYVVGPKCSNNKELEMSMLTTWIHSLSAMQ